MKTDMQPEPDPHPAPAPRPTARERIERRIAEGTLDPRLIRFVDDDGAGVAVVGVPAPGRQGERPTPQQPDRAPPAGRPPGAAR
jgi:hypothetical protein